MATEIKLRRDRYANWTSLNPVLAEGEIGLVTNFADNNTRIKIGDGVTAWEDLDYFTTSQDLSNYVTDAELASALSNYVPISRTVNGKALSSNISIDKTDVGLGNVDNTNDASKPISTATQTALDLKQDKAIVVSSNQTAVNDAMYHNVATATYTDPTPVEGKGFIVFVRNGTATVGGTAYATAGTIINRTFHSGAWSNYVYLNKAQLDSAYQSTLVSGTNIKTVNGNSLLGSGNLAITGFDPTTNTITPTPLSNTAIANGDTVNAAFGKTQGQIDSIIKNEIGQVISEQFSSTANFTGYGSAFTVSGGNLVIAGGSTKTLATALYQSAYGKTSSHNWTQQITITAGTLSATSYGVGLGVSQGLVTITGAVLLERQAFVNLLFMLITR
jgi:hypothetical protein